MKDRAHLQQTPRSGTDVGEGTSSTNTEKETDVGQGTSPSNTEK